MQGLLTGRNAVLVVLLLTLWRLDLAAHLQLHPDEAYYWLWSRRLDAGYFDHAPLVAYAIRLTTLGSEAEPWVRLSGLLVVPALSVLSWQLALRLYGNPAVAAGAVLLFNALPLSMLGLLVMTPDVPLCLFSALCVYLLAAILQRGDARLWYLWGLCFGLALLSKYTAVLLAPAALLALLASPGRRWLRTPHPYLALLLGLACFVPVLDWNRRHDWVSFAFQLHNGLGGKAASLGQVLAYAAGQLLICGPLAWLLGLAAALRPADAPARLLTCTSVPVIAFFGLTSYHTLAGPNWPLFAYFGFSLLASGYGLDGASPRRRGFWWAAFLSSLGLSLLLTLHARYGLLPLARYAPQLAAADATNAFYGWRELGHALQQAPEPPAVLAPSHQLSAEIVYYSGGRVAARPEAAGRTSQFELWAESPRAPAGQRLYVWTAADGAATDGTCAHALPAAQLDGWRDGRVIRRYYLAASPPPLPAACRAPWAAAEQRPRASLPGP